MKALIQKELRENLKLAAVGLLLAIAVVVGTQFYYINLILGIGSGVSTAQDYSYRLQPLTSGNFEVFSGILCVLVGMAIGWFQIHHERHRDLWAFLVHRPVTRTTIFLSKSIAGLILYTLTVGLPLSLFVLWVKSPGHVAAPFEWSMARPAFVAFLSGAAWYFAGMLTGIRQARWYGSKGLGLGSALLVTIAVDNGISVWMLILAIVTLALAVWGAFHNQGQFEGQPGAGKAALTLSLTPGAGLAFVAIVALALEIIVGTNGVTISPHYAIIPYGAIYKISESNGVPQIVSLHGKQLMDPETGRPMELDKFNRQGSLGGVAASYRQKAGASGLQEDTFRLFSGGRQTLWFTVERTGRIEGYDVRTRRFIGSFGTNGFAADEKGDGTGFLPNDERPSFYGNKAQAQVLASTISVYQIDVENRTIKPFWTTTDDDPIEAYGSDYEGVNTVVLTRHNIHYFQFSYSGSKPEFTVPSTYSDQDDSTVTVYLHEISLHGLDKPDETEFIIWITPSAWANFEDHPKPPTHVLWVSANGEITKREDLPDLEPRRGPEVAQQILTSFLPPALGLMPRWLSNEPIGGKTDWHEIELSFRWSMLCVPLGFWLGRRYGLSVKSQFAWACFNLFFGIPGLLAFVSVQTWPVRETCPQCKKLRAVDREKCEHCGAEFAPPMKNGTEIFEPLEVH